MLFTSEQRKLAQEKVTAAYQHMDQVWDTLHEELEIELQLPPEAVAQLLVEEG